MLHLKKRVPLLICILSNIAILLILNPYTSKMQAEATEEITPEATVFYEHQGLFPSFPLSCPEDMPISEGPTWRTITIGRSVLDDIENLYGVRFTLENQPSWVTGSFAPAYGILLTADGARRWGLPQSADLCVIDGKIAALSLLLDEEFPPGWIIDWVNRYGIPELVAWPALGNDWCWRVIVWPQQGIAVSVYAAAVEDQPGAALVNSVTLFPYAQGDDYLSAWPYTALNRQPPSSTNEGCPTAENPFDFEALLPEATQQP